MKNFNYFALVYLNDWYQWDKLFSERITSSKKEDSRAAFHEAAKYYKVTRNFSHLENEMRLAAAKSMLLSVRGPITEENVCKKVSGLAEKFKGKYGKNAVSASSKFLWLRYKSPVVIFDSRAIAWLRENDYAVPYKGGYKEYREQWLLAFNDNETEIRSACAGLLAVKSYSLAADIADQEITKLANQRWFMERVFDKFLWSNAGGS